MRRRFDVIKTLSLRRMFAVELLQPIWKQRNWISSYIVGQNSLKFARTIQVNYPHSIEQQFEPLPVEHTDRPWIYKHYLRDIYCDINLGNLY